MNADLAGELSAFQNAHRNGNESVIRFLAGAKAFYGDRRLRDLVKRILHTLGSSKEPSVHSPIDDEVIQICNKIAEREALEREIEGGNSSLQWPSGCEKYWPTTKGGRHRRSRRGKKSKRHLSRRHR